MGLAQNSVRGIKFPNHSIYAFSGNGLIFGWTVPHFCLQWWEPRGRLIFFLTILASQKNGDDSPTAGFQPAAFRTHGPTLVRTKLTFDGQDLWDILGPSNEGKNIQIYKGICQPLSIFRTNYQDPLDMNVFFCIFVSSEHQKVPNNQLCFFKRGRWSGQMTQMTPTRRESHPNIKRHHLQWSQWNAAIPWNSQQKPWFLLGCLKKGGWD